MSLAPPRGSRMSMAGMFAGPSGGGAPRGLVSPFSGGLFASRPQMPQMPTMPSQSPGLPQMPPQMPPQAPPQMPPQSGPSFPPVMPSTGTPLQPSLPSSSGYQSGEQAAGHPILLPSITALMTGIATSRPPDPNMMWDTSKGQWTSDLSAYTRK